MCLVESLAAGISSEIKVLFAFEGCVKPKVKLRINEGAALHLL
jgi:hypothetical protein